MTGGYAKVSARTAYRRRRALGKAALAGAAPPRRQCGYTAHAKPERRRPARREGQCGYTAHAKPERLRPAVRYD